MTEKAKLEIELVPQTCWCSNVRNHITKKQWEMVKESVAKKAGDKCEICGGRGRKWATECHEIWGYGDAVRMQTLLGLIALCPDCHIAKHFGMARIRGKDKQAMWHMCRVNGWTIEQGVDHVNAQFDVWKERSTHEWSVDLSFMQRAFGITIEEEEASVRAEYGKA